MKIKDNLKKILVKEKLTPINIPIYEGKLLENRVAIIIGGSGGIGFAIAKRFISNKCKVVLTGTNKDNLIKYCKLLGNNARYMILNVCEVDNFAKIIKESENFFGKIDTLVYSAGIHGLDELGMVKEETWDNVMDVNLKGMYFLNQEFSNYLLANNLKGHILNISSASCAKPGWTPYEISKWGVRALTLGFADKLANKGIVVNSIAPGPVSTAMLGREAGDNLTWTGNPTGRMSSPEEIANLALFMCSNMGDMIVGDTYFISGGSGTTCIDK